MAAIDMRAFCRIITAPGYLPVEISGEDENANMYINIDPKRAQKQNNRVINIKKRYLDRDPLSKKYSSSSENKGRFGKIFMNIKAKVATTPGTIYRKEKDGELGILLALKITIPSINNHHPNAKNVPAIYETTRFLVCTSIESRLGCTYL